ncbi:MAG: hypothetical protein EOO75_11585, partial [Myxococcales bacterium]
MARPGRGVTAPGRGVTPDGAVAPGGAGVVPGRVVISTPDEGVARGTPGTSGEVVDRAARPPPERRDGADSSWVSPLPLLPPRPRGAARRTVVEVDRTGASAPAPASRASWPRSVMARSRSASRPRSTST